ncbi:hypothetical protein MLD38_000765 [Melastoma candidum]|uniref:Uncharacterized protein n=1 Tax=Melastoma candidum TaxID=119954 RepID=A0ACB9SAM6_9MYRT|nr:hypothetical protein MLD38_000765 [Melastoma candidum]
MRSVREAGSEVCDGDNWDDDDDEDDDDGTTNDFLSRFVWIMRSKLNEAYPDCNKQAVDGGDSVSHDLYEDLWRTVWEVSNKVVEDMEKKKKKEKMKGFLQDLKLRRCVGFLARWSKVVDKIHEAEEVAFPQEPKPITGKCELATEKILSMGMEDDPSPLLAEWVESFCNLAGLIRFLCR